MLKQTVKKAAHSAQGAADIIRRMPATQRLLFDPITERVYWRTEGAGWMNIEDVNAFCLTHILTKLEDEGKDSGKLYAAVSRCADRRGVLHTPAHERWEHGD